MSNKPSASISKLVFSGGSEFSLGSKEKVILVGPNNSGKSQSLREKLSICQYERKERPYVVKDVQLLKAGTTEDLRKFLDKKGSYVKGEFRYEDWTIQENHLHLWSQPYLPYSVVHGLKKILPPMID